MIAEQTTIKLPAGTEIPTAALSEWGFLVLVVAILIGIYLWRRG